MPTVHIYLWSGRDADFKKTMIAKITKVFEDQGIPGQAVEVLIHDVPKENWGISGIPASEKFPDIP
jgi:4-oxalocrotonate tautomerase